MKEIASYEQQRGCWLVKKEVLELFPEVASSSATVPAPEEPRKSSPSSTDAETKNQSPAQPESGRKKVFTLDAFAKKVDKSEKKIFRYPFKKLKKALILQRV
jgi:hypothetical protein